MTKLTIADLLPPYVVTQQHKMAAAAFYKAAKIKASKGAIGLYAARLAREEWERAQTTEKKV